MIRALPIRRALELWRSLSPATPAVIRFTVRSQPISSTAPPVSRGSHDQSRKRLLDRGCRVGADSSHDGYVQHFRLHGHPAGDHQQTPSMISLGNTFGLQVAALDQYGNLATGFSGNVSVSLGTNPEGASLGGALTVPAYQGIATFTGLSLNNTGTGYSLMVSSPGLSAAVSTATIEVIARPPVIISEQVVMHRKTNKKGKPVGKATLAGFQLNFSTAMNSATTGNAANYQVDTVTIKKVKKSRVTVLKPCGSA